MRAFVTILTAAALVAGCGGSSHVIESEGILATDDRFSDEAPPLTATTTGAAAAANEVPLAELTPDPSLPAPPWASDRVRSGDVPAELVQAWESADNRDRCALLAPAAIDGARARRADYDGGWAVEFDKRGMPGLAANGSLCRSCGRGAFGIAGTALSVDDEDPMEAEERAFRDGSRVRLEPPLGDDDDLEGATGAVASLKIRGQDCVYQVWSFAGDEHLDALIEELRFVETN